MKPFFLWLGSSLGAVLWAQSAPSLRMETQVLTSEFIAEGADAGDLDGDGHVDVIAGYRWWRGPDFREARDLGPVSVFDRRGYSNAFFDFIHDLDGDGDLDVLVVGFPGQEARVILNQGGTPAEFQNELVFEGVDNESPMFLDVTGDGRPDLVCQHDGALGYAQYDPAAVRSLWSFRPISEGGQGGKFTHGLGVGDVSGDGRPDILNKSGWWEAPESSAEETLWRYHPVAFAGPGGAQMLVADFDADGDTDVVTSVHAHGYGLLFWERAPDSPSGWTKHELMTDRAGDREDELCFGGLHALALTDLDRDGQPDFITGNRAWSHGGADAADHDPAYVVWWRPVPGSAHKAWTTRVLARDSGVGVQVVARDVNADGNADILVASKNGVFVHRQAPARDPRALLIDEVPERARGEWPRTLDGQRLNLGFEAGDLSDWTPSGDAFANHPVQGDRVRARRADMQSGHVGRYWAGSYESGREDEAEGTLLSVAFPVTHAYGTFWVGGGARKDVGVDLLLDTDGSVVATAQGRDQENLHQVTVPLDAHRGKMVRIRLRDGGKGHWGHLNFDEFRWHDQAPRGSELLLRDRTPKEAAAAMEVPEGFHVDVVAAEPALHQPIAFAFDARGRIYVAEAHSYPTKRGLGKGMDRVVVFADEDGDGEFERRTVFIEGLDLVSGLEVGQGGVWIGAAPELLFIPDRDGDLRPDGPGEVILDGFGYQDTHETLNSFVWGRDGWLWGTHGVFTHSRVGRPGTPDAARIPINAGVWRFHPRSRRFEVVAHGTSNPWGIDFDAQGEAFIEGCVIPHLWHIVPGGRYQRQAGSHFDAWVTDDLPTIADHVHWVGETPHGGNGRSENAGGGHAHCGLVVVQSALWPKEMQGLVLMGNIHGNRIVADRVAAKGASFIGTHAGDFLLAHDPAFRLISMRFGPDGQLYFIDWYDRQACHRTDPEIWDRSNGRLYRLRFGEARGYTPVIPPNRDSEWLEALRHPEVWHRRMAVQRLVEVGMSDGVREQLWSEVLDQTGDPAVRAMQALHAAAGEDSCDFGRAFRHPDALVRASALRALADTSDDHVQASLLQYEALIRTEASPVVIREVLALLPRLPSPSRSEWVSLLLARADLAGDMVLEKLAWFGLGSESRDRPEVLLGWVARSTWMTWNRWCLARLLDGARRPRTLEGLVFDSWRAENRRLFFECLGELARDPRGLSVDAALARILEAGHADPDEVVRRLASELSAVLSPAREGGSLADIADLKLPLLMRRHLVRKFLAGGDETTRHSVIAHLNDAGLRPVILDGLAGSEDPSVAKDLIQSLPTLDAHAERDVIRLLGSRLKSARELVAWARESGRTEHLDDPVLRSSLAHLGDPELLGETKRENLSEAPSRAERVLALQRYLGSLRAGRPEAGRRVFVKTCMPCHRLFLVGADVGPELTGSQRADASYVLANLVDPSAEVPEAYRVTTVELEDGRMLDGVLERRDEEGLVLKTAGGREHVLISDVAMNPDGTKAVKTSHLSMMPDDLLERVDPQDLQDLLSYLAAPAQTSLDADARVAPWFPTSGGLGFWTSSLRAEAFGSGLRLTADGPNAKPAFAQSDFLVRGGRFLASLRVSEGANFLKVQVVGQRGFRQILEVSAPSTGTLLATAQGKSVTATGDALESPSCHVEIDLLVDQALVFVNGDAYPPLAVTGPGPYALRFVLEGGRGSTAIVERLKLEPLEPPK